MLLLQFSRLQLFANLMQCQLNVFHCPKKKLNNEGKPWVVNTYVEFHIFMSKCIFFSLTYSWLPSACCKLCCLVTVIGGLLLALSLGLFSAYFPYPSHASCKLDWSVLEDTSLLFIWASYYVVYDLLFTIYVCYKVSHIMIIALFFCILKP